MNHENGGRAIRSALVLCLGALFFLLAAGVALLSSNIYRSVAAAGDTTSTLRTAVSYVANQVRRGDVAGGVDVVDFGGVPALCLREELEDGYTYVTLIYCYDGQLREFYVEEGYETVPEDGEPILPLTALELSRSAAAIRIEARAGEEVLSVDLAPRTELPVGEEDAA